MGISHRWKSEKIRSPVVHRTSVKGVDLFAFCQILPHPPSRTGLFREPPSFQGLSCFTRGLLGNPSPPNCDLGHLARARHEIAAAPEPTAGLSTTAPARCWTTELFRPPKSQKPFHSLRFISTFGFSQIPQNKRPNRG